METTAPAAPAPPQPGRAPSWSPSAHELDDLEALLLGAYAPLHGFLGPQDAASVTSTGRLVDGTPWPVPVTLHVPHPVAARAAAEGSLVLLDEEGAEVGVVHNVRTHPVDRSCCMVEGRVATRGASERGSHRWLRRTAAGVSRPECLLGVPVDRPLHSPQIAQLRACARALGADIRLIPAATSGRRPGGDLDGSALVRTCIAAARELDADVVPVPVPHHGDPDRDRLLLAHVAQTYGATHLPAPFPAWHGALPVIVELPQVARARGGGSWEPLERVPVAARAGTCGDDTWAEVGRLVRLGEPVPTWLTSPAVVREMRRRRRQGSPGFTVLLTGLSGSGKSTIGRALHATLLERTDRTVTLLDGDVVRRMLSSELTFSREHREMNLRRIGWVAAEVTRHGGVAICTPIAPYAGSRHEMRTMVDQHGEFLLVHVATALEVCEARDRKGLYAKARAGTLPAFTGISDPYEAPDDADVELDTAVVPVQQAVDTIIDELVGRGWLDPTRQGG